MVAKYTASEENMHLDKTPANSEDIFVNLTARTQTQRNQTEKLLQVAQTLKRVLFFGMAVHGFPL